MLYEVLLVQHKYGTHKVYLANEYAQYKVMQDIREIELRDSGSNANNKICFEVRTTSLSPRLHTEPSTKGSSPRNYNSTLGVHYYSLNHNHLYTRGIGTKPKHNQLYTRGIRHKAEAQPQLPLHNRDKAQR